MFSSKSLIVSGLTFRSLIYFEFIFVYGVKECSNFILLHVAVQFSQHHLLKRLSFLHCIFLPPLLKTRWPYVRGFISGLSILFHWSIFLFLCQYHTVLTTVASNCLLFCNSAWESKKNKAFMIWMGASWPPSAAWKFLPWPSSKSTILKPHFALEFAGNLCKTAGNIAIIVGWDLHISILKCFPGDSNV